MGSVRCIIWCCLCLLVVGCGFPQAKLDEARDHVDLALSAWKKGDKPESLKSLPQAIEFYDDAWVKGHVLSDYKIKETYYHAEDERVRCVVEMTLRSPGPRGKQRTEETVYNVLLGSPPKIDVNPMP